MDERRFDELVKSSASLSRRQLLKRFSVGAAGALGVAALGSSRMAAEGGKVIPKKEFTICHHPPGNPDNAQTITVGSQHAVDAHLDNHPEDTLGPCSDDNGKHKKGKDKPLKKGKDDEHRKDKEEQHRKN
jgi:hypothetical protein